VDSQFEKVDINEIRATVATPSRAANKRYTANPETK
jgi:hypothetical protein